MQNDFRMVVTDKTFAFRKKSPTNPNKMPENNRAKYGRLARTPACAILKPRTYELEEQKPNNIIFIACSEN